MPPAATLATPLAGCRPQFRMLNVAKTRAPPYSIGMKRWIVKHPRLLYLAILPAMVGGFVAGSMLYGFWGMIIMGPLCMVSAMYLYILFRLRLLREIKKAEDVNMTNAPQWHPAAR